MYVLTIFATGAIERGAVDGNTFYWKDYEKVLMNECKEAVKPGETITESAVETTGATPAETKVQPVVVDEVTAFSPTGFVLSFYTRFGPIISAVLLILTIINGYYLLRLYQMNSELDRILSATAGADVTIGQTSRTLPRWWFEGYDSQDFLSRDVQTRTQLEQLLKRYHEGVTEPALVRFLREQGHSASSTFSQLVESFREQILDDDDAAASSSRNHDNVNLKQ